MNIALPPKKVMVTMGFKAIAYPREGITSINEARDKWLGNHPKNKILDYGDSKDLSLLVAQEETTQVEYKLIPELSPPGATLEFMAAHMKANGMQVVGINHDRQTVTVLETKVKT